MKVIAPTLPRYTCTRCKHVWIPRREHRPFRCPGCNSPYWFKPRMAPVKKIVGALVAVCALGVGAYAEEPWVNPLDPAPDFFAPNKSAPTANGTRTRTLTPTPAPVPTPTPEPTPSPKVLRAARKLAQYGKMMRVRAPIGIVVDLSPATYPGSVLAHTTRNAFADGCTVHSTEEALELDWVLAHETCHCANDYWQFTAYGYKEGTPHEEVALREANAKLCGARLLKIERERARSWSASNEGWWGR